MIITVKPAPFLKGQIQLPASKSYSIRGFMAALCGGRSTIIHPSDCDDALVAMRVIKALGARVIGHRNHCWEVVAAKNKKKSLKINVKESGTVLRLLLPLLFLYSERATVMGEGTLKTRPNLFLMQALRRMGLAICGEGEKETVPMNEWRRAVGR